MKVIILIIPLILINGLRTLGQANIDQAVQLIVNADSVILISHVAIEEYHDKPLGEVLQPGVVDTRKPILFPSFLVEGNINPAIIVQRRLLPKQDIVALAKIILKPVEYGNNGIAHWCFEPHHAILIYNKGHFSYIDLCFHCSGLVTSLDLELTDMDFQDGKWKKMKAFFLKHGLTYEMQDKY